VAIRLALIIPTLDRSGAEKQFTLLATGLPRDEFDVHVALLTRGGAFEAELSMAGIPVTRIGKRFKCDPMAWWRLRNWLKRLQPDIVHTWLFAANAYGRLAVRAVPKAGVIVSERCVDSWKAGWQHWLDRKLLPGTDRVIGNSQSVVDFYREHGVPGQKLVMIPNGISPFTPPDLSRAALLERLRFPPDAFVAMYVGRLAPQKRVDDLVWAVETLRQIRPQLRLVLVGDGPARDSLQRFARDIHCQEHVRFVGMQDDVANWLNLADVFWLASSFEGMSNSLMEAMAAGKPCVVSDIPPNRELIDQAVHGFLVPPGDTVAFMQFTRRLIDELELREQLGNAARSRTLRDFSVDRMRERHIALYREVIAEHRVPAGVA
jgi:glycosyltransferase involved in cell wall biosynthesis